MNRITFIVLLLAACAKAQTPIDAGNPGPTTRPLAATAITLSPTIQASPSQVVIYPDPVHTIDLPLWPAYYGNQSYTVRINVKMISAVVPHTATIGTQLQTGSSIYCWPADIWYSSLDVTTLTGQLSQQGWGQGSLAAPPPTTQASLPLRAPETPKPYSNPANVAAGR